MKSRLLALNPIKIQNRLVPNNTSVAFSLNNYETKSQTQISSNKKVENVGGLDSVSSLRKVITDPGTQSSIKVTIHRSNTLKRSDSVQSGSERLSQSSDSFKDVSLPVQKQYEDLFQKPTKQAVTRVRQQSSTLKTVNQVISSEYYNEIDNRINNGIKKLREMDKRLVAYENRQQQQSTNLIITEKQKQKQINNSRLNTSSQLRQTNDAMTKKKEDYLQQILYKSKKVKELQEAISDKNKKISQLQNLIKVFNIKIIKLQQNTKGYLQSEQNYKINVTKLLLQIQTKNQAIQALKKEDQQKRKKLELKLQQKTKQINAKSNQYILRIKKQLQYKQAALLQQIQKYRQQNNKIMSKFFQQKQQQICHVRDQYEEKLRNKAKQYAQIINKYYLNKQKEKQNQSQKVKYTQIIKQLQNKLKINIQQIKQLSINVNCKTQQIAIKNSQILSKDSKIQQISLKLKQQLSQKQIMRQNLNAEHKKRQQLELKTNKLEQQLKKLEDLILKNENIVEKLTSDVQLREFQYKSSLQSYQKQIKLLQQKNQTLKIKNKTLEGIVQNIENSKQTEDLKQKQKNIQYGILQDKLKQFQTFNLQNLMKIADFQNQITKSNQKINLLLQNKAQSEKNLKEKQVSIQSLKIKFDLQIKTLKQLSQAKQQTNSIKIKQNFQEIKKLNQQINSYKCKAEQNQKVLQEKNKKLIQVQNLFKNQEKQYETKKNECEKLLQQNIHYDIKIKQIDQITKKCVKNFSMLIQNINYGQIADEKKDLSNQFSKIIQDEQNISLNLIFSTIQKLYKGLIENKSSLQKQNKKLKKQIINIPQKDILPKIILKTEVGSQTQIKTQQKEVFTQKFCYENTQCQTTIQQKYKLKIVQQLNINVSNIKVKKQQVINSKVQKKEQAKISFPQKMMSTNDTQKQQGENDAPLSQQNIIEQITILKQDLTDKQHIIEVMQSCIQDYKQMINNMKSKLQFQEKIECQYNQVLEFFQIDPQKTIQEAHEQLLELISVLMSKLENTVQAVKQLQQQLIKVNQENCSMKEKKKKILRQIKKYEQMAERACIENDQLKFKNLQLIDKLDGTSIYMKQINNLLDDTNEDMLKFHAKMLNTKLQRNVEADEEMNEMSIIYADNEKQKALQFEQTGIDNTLEGVSPINNKRMSEMVIDSAIDEQQYNEQNKQTSAQQQINMQQQVVIKTPQPKQKDGNAQDFFANKSPDVLQYKTKSQNQYDAVQKESEVEQKNEN